MSIVELLEDTRPKIEDIKLGFKIPTFGRFGSTERYHNHVVGLYGERFIDSWLHSEKFANLPKLKKPKGLGNLPFSIKKSNFGYLIVNDEDESHISEIDNYAYYEDISFFVEVKTGFINLNELILKLKKDTILHENLFPNFNRMFLIFNEPEPNIVPSLLNFPIISLDLSANYFQIRNYLIESGEMKANLYESKKKPRYNPFSELKITFE